MKPAADIWGPPLAAAMAQDESTLKEGLADVRTQLAIRVPIETQISCHGVLIQAETHAHHGDWAETVRILRILRAGWEAGEKRAKSQQPYRAA